MNPVKYYNNGKIKIGQYYEPPKYVEQDCDMLLIQSYLIHDPGILNRRYWIDKIVFGSSCFVLMVVCLKLMLT
jgi:hypothetical protein